MRKFLNILLAVVLAVSTTLSFAKGISGGRSVGMSRPAVTSMARPSYTPTPSYRAPTYAPTAPAQRYYGGTPGIGGNGPSLAGTALAAGAGAAVGSVVGNALSHPHGGAGTTVINNGAGGVPGAAMAPGYAPQGYAAPPVVYQSGFSFWAALFGFLKFVLFLAVAAAIVFALVLLYRKFRQSRPSKYDGGGFYGASALNPNGTMNLPFSAIERFFAVQDAFAQNDKSKLSGMLGPDMQYVLREVTDPLNPAAKATFVGVSYDTLAVEYDEVSVQFRATDTAEKRDINEVWHFIRVGNQWVLNGIDQV